MMFLKMFCHLYILPFHSDRIKAKRTIKAAVISHSELASPAQDCHFLHKTQLKTVAADGWNLSAY